MSQEHAHHLRAYIILIVILIAMGILFYFLQAYFLHGGIPKPVPVPAEQPQSVPAAPVPSSFPPNAPPPTSADFISTP